MRTRLKGDVEQRRRKFSPLSVPQLLILTLWYLPRAKESH